MTTARDVETARALIVKLRLPVFEPLVSAIAAALSERERETVERCAKAVDALRILLASHDCLAPDGGAEIPEELSARFDIGLDDARQVCAALEKERN